MSEALEAYKKLGNASDLSGRSGYRIGSDSYMHTLERDVFGCTVPTSYSADWGEPAICQAATGSVTGNCVADTA